MNETLYIQIHANANLSHPDVRLSDIAALSCVNIQTLERAKNIVVLDLSDKKGESYVCTAAQLIQIIQQKEPDLTLSVFGEVSFLVTYKEKRSHSSCNIIKIILVSLLSFFGSAFSIMTFHNDIDIKQLFSQIYLQVTGQPSNGFTILEISYSIGIGVGVLFFFNHFGRKKITSDPTPLQVQMCQYESQINTTIIEETARNKEGL